MNQSDVVGFFISYNHYNIYKYFLFYLFIYLGSMSIFQLNEGLSLNNDDSYTQFYKEDRVWSL